MNFTGEVITSRQNRIVVDVVKLSDKKSREKSRLFRFDGCKLLLEALEKDVAINRILVSESKAEQIVSVLNKAKNGESEIKISVLTDELFAKVSEEQAPEGVICVAEYPKHHSLKAEKSELLAMASDLSKRVLMLESVRDPGNMGTIIRSAAAFGVDTVVISSDCADIYNSKTVRAAMGALFKIGVVSCDDFVGAVEVLKGCGRKVYAAALDKNAVRLDEIDFNHCDTAVIGNEGHGLSSETAAACTRSLYIPMENGCESLNAAIAASVIMWSMYKN
ncbi:MAG: RNA methyltransferase [Clostridia bacterium]|nr:RNA methyltransferase [Clostridia bacterium]